MGLISDFGVMMGRFAFSRFDHYTSHAMETQERILMKIVKENKNCELGKKFDFENIHSIEDYQAKVPLTTFEDYAPLIDRMVENNEKNVITSKRIIRYCASSGTAGKPKLQPKTARDIWNMQCCGFAATPGCADRYFRSKGLMKKLPGQIGPMMMSLNGHKLKNGKMSNGAAQVPFQYLKPILKFFITTPKDILYPEDEENTNISYFQLRFCLPNKKVTFLGSMVITMLSNAFEYLEHNWEMICDDIEKGTIDPSVKCPPSLRAKYGHMKPNPERAEELRAVFRQGFDEPVAQKIWPELCWGYGMISSTLSVYMDTLRRYIGDLPMHNMGYAASEGYMAMPVELNSNDYVLLPRSLFYEFIPVDDEEEVDAQPITLDKLEVGKKYEIIVTNFSGLYRYRILDIVRCTGTYNQSKKIEFLYRSNMGLNIANEKTTTDMLDYVVERVQDKFDLKFEGFSFYSQTEGDSKHYVLYVECDSDVIREKREEINAYIDDMFREANEKYDKYRHWGMIGMPEIIQFENGTYEVYKQSLVAQGRILNQIKPVTVINTPEKKEFFFAHILKDDAAAE